MKFVAFLALASLPIWGFSDDHHEGHMKFEANAINSPVKESMVKIKLEGPQVISKVFFSEKNGGKEFEGTLENTASGYVGRFKASQLKVGTYEYKVRVIVPKEKHGHQKHDEECNSGFVDFTKFVIDSSLEVADPGEAGKKTLAGIDSDKNGIRDDIQRMINETFSINSKPNSNKAFKQVAKYYEQALLQNANEAQSKANYLKFLDSSYCMYWIMGGGAGRGLPHRPYTKRLTALYANTQDRVLASLRMEGYFRGYLFKSRNQEGSTFCEFAAVRD